MVLAPSGFYLSTNAVARVVYLLNHASCRLICLTLTLWRRIGSANDSSAALTVALSLLTIVLSVHAVGVDVMTLQSLFAGSRYLWQGGDALRCAGKAGSEAGRIPTLKGKAAP